MRSLILGVSLVLASCGGPTTTERLGLPALQTVERVEVDRYLGDWFEVASFPQDVQAGCSGTNTNYALRDDGEIDITNRCIKDGEEDVATGIARIVDTDTNAKLEISFFRPFYGDYWVIELGDELPDEYSYAVVGHPSRDYLWILSRTPTLDNALYDNVVSRLQTVGYEIDRLAKTPQ
jgi:apolipoprotein D and lipocalin family protein